MRARDGSEPPFFLSLHSLIAVVAILFSGCGGESESTNLPTDCSEGGDVFVGDPNADPELTLLTQDDQGLSIDVGDGDEVSLVGRFSQGGVSTLLLFGVKYRNMGTCSVSLEASIRDDASGQVRIDKRTVSFSSIEDGWAVSSNAADYANIPACPNQWSSRDIFNESYSLLVTVTDSEEKTVSQSIQITPVCSESTAVCTCICSKGYMLGETC